MVLRSRKPGRSNEVTKFSQIDSEAQGSSLRSEEDKNSEYHKILIRTEAFNLLWRDFIFKITFSLIFYSIYSGYVYKANSYHLVYDMSSAVSYAITSTWIKNIIDSQKVFELTKNFKLILVTISFQTVYYIWYYIKQKDITQRVFFPGTAFYLLFVLALLFYMKRNIQNIQSAREKILH